MFTIPWTIFSIFKQKRLINMPLLGIRTKSNKTFTLNWKPLLYWAIKILLKVKTRYSNIIVRKKTEQKITFIWTI